MSRELLASKVVVFEEEPHVRGIQAAPTAVAAAVGVTKRGPVNKAVLCTSFDEYLATFGGFTETSDLALAAKGFFENGGSQLWVSRVVSEDAEEAQGQLYLLLEPGPLPATAIGGPPPFSLWNGAELRLLMNGPSGEGYAWTITFRGLPARVQAGEEPYALTNGSVLEVSVNGEAPQSVTFSSGQFANIGAATAIEVMNAINEVLVGAQALVFGTSFSIESATAGTGGQLLIGTTAAGTALGLSGASSSGTGNVVDLNAVTFQDVQNVLEEVGLGTALYIQTLGSTELLGFRSLSTGPTASIQVVGSARIAFSLDGDIRFGTVEGRYELLVGVQALEKGADGNRIRVRAESGPTNGPSEFDLVVELPGENGAPSIVETFPNVTRVPDAARYIDTVVNDPVTGSKLIRVFNFESTDFPDAVPEPVTITLEDGEDEVEALTDEDFIGDEADGTGLHAFDDIQDITLLMVPGQATPAVHNAMLTYCEVARDGLTFAILDPPAGISAEDMVNYVTSDAALQNASEHGAIYWPRVKVLNPDKKVFGKAPQIVVPPSGILAGMYARNDAATPGGVYVSPAGTEAGRLFGVLGFETDETLSERKRDLVYPVRINPLTTRPGSPKFADGSRTLKEGGAFPFIAERRGVSFIERSLREGLQFARHKNNTPELRAEVRRTVTAFLLTQMYNGAFASRDASKAFFVDVSDQLNTASVIASGRLLVRIGLATNKPAEFIVLQISQDTRALEAELAAAE
jgi:phage tail sheath protein FI